jgi:hypothetical protein
MLKLDRLYNALLEARESIQSEIVTRVCDAIMFRIYGDTSVLLKLTQLRYDLVRTTIAYRTLFCFTATFAECLV